MTRSRKPVDTEAIAPLAPSHSPADFFALFPEFQGPSWSRWRDILKRLTPNVREFWAIVGRGAGKSRIVALLAAYFAAQEYPLVSGESVYVAVFAPDRKQAGVTFRYIVGLIRSVPSLAVLVANETKDTLELVNGVIVEVLSASIAAPRGRSYALVIVEEAAFLPSDGSANPDVELVRALTPGLGRVPGSLLCVVSSPYARRGLLWHAFQRHHGQPDGDVVFIQGATLDLNPLFDQRAVARAYEDDPASAAAEYGGQFRTDVESFVSLEAIAACVVPGRREVPVHPAIGYQAFVDPSGGSGDSFTLAIAHQGTRDGQPIVIIDAVRETRPPFSPEAVVAEYAALAKTYGVALVVGDRYAGEFPRELFRKHGIVYEPSAKPKSELYVDALALLNSRQIELLDHPRAIAQLAGLERRTSRGGRDSVDHAPGSFDDLANVCAGVAVEVGTAPGGYGVGHARIEPAFPSEERPRTSADIEQENDDYRRLLERHRQSASFPYNDNNWRQPDLAPVDQGFQHARCETDDDADRDR